MIDIKNMINRKNTVGKGSFAVKYLEKISSNQANQDNQSLNQVL